MVMTPEQAIEFLDVLIGQDRLQFNRKQTLGSLEALRTLSSTIKEWRQINESLAKEREVRDHPKAGPDIPCSQPAPLPASITPEREVEIRKLNEEAATRIAQKRSEMGTPQ